MKRLAQIIGLLIAIVALSFIVMIFLIYRTAARDTDITADALVVLGAAQYDGTPSPVFQSRLDHAYTLYEQHRAPNIIVSGGKQEGDTYSEAMSGKKYLTEKGVPASVLFVDENSYSTKHNLARVKEIADAQQFKTLIVVSDPFHMYRALTISKDLGLTVAGSPTRTSPITENNWLEFKYVAREAMLTYAHIIFDL